MVGCVKSGTLEDDPNRLVDLMQCFFIAFRATCKRFVVEMLEAVELNAAIFTSVRINGHALFSLLRFGL